jgi:hypothetical protein
MNVDIKEELNIEFDHVDVVGDFDIDIKDEPI